MFDQTQLRDWLSYSNVIDEISTTLLSSYGSHTEESRNIFSSSFANTSSYANIMTGITKQSGVASYQDAFFQTAGEYLDFHVPGGSFSTDSAIYSTPMAIG